MKIGTVKWFNLQKGYGFIHSDDGGPNIFVHIAAVGSAGMSDLKEGQRVIFEIQRDERTGKASAVSLKPLVFATTSHLYGSFATANPFDISSAFI
jgi:cold shock protein